MFSFLFRAAFTLALVYYLVPFDAIFGPGTGSFLSTTPSASRPEPVADTRSVTTTTILVRPDGRTVRVTAEPTVREESGQDVAAAAPAAGHRPGVAEVMGFCDRNPRVCDFGVDILYGAANRAGDALEALGALVKPETQPARRTASAASQDTLTDGDRMISPTGRSIP